MREAREETGLTDLHLAAFLGERDFDVTPFFGGMKSTTVRSSISKRCVMPQISGHMRRQAVEHMNRSCSSSSGLICRTASRN